ncbi:MAG: integrase [Rhodothermales bacterium]|jgi:integrase
MATDNSERSTTQLVASPAMGALRDRLAAPDTNLIEAFLHRFDNERTRRSYKNDLRQFFGDSQVPLAVAQGVTFFHVNDYLAGLTDEGLKPATLRRRMAAIRGFYDWLDALGLIAENPTKKQLIRRLPGIRASDRAILVLTAAQASALLEVAAESPTAGVRDSTLLKVLLYLVLRRSEASAMDVNHIRSVGGYWVLDLPDTKGGPDQYVKVPDHLAVAIQEHREHYGIHSGPLWRSFSRSSPGHRLTPNSIYRIVKGHAQSGALPDIGAHTLRHTGCTLAIESGASLQQVQAHARHKKLETTMTYIHQRDRLRDSAADFIHIGPAGKSGRRGQPDSDS